MTQKQTAQALATFFNDLLAMTADEKRRALEQLGAPNADLTKEGKEAVLLAMAEANRPGIASQMAQVLATEEQRYLALDILREPIQVVSLETMAKTLGAPKNSAKNIKAGTRASYLAFTFANNDAKRINGLLQRIGLQVAEISNRPTDLYLSHWTAATIHNSNMAANH